MTTWMSGPCKGDREGQQEADCFLPLTLSLGLPCCFCAKVSQSPPALSCVLPPQPHLPSCPTPTQRIFVSAQDVGLICVSESSMYLCLRSIHATQANEAYPWI